MTAFLAWIYAQSVKVYSWFGNSFYALYEGASKAWDWAVTQANNAYSAAINYIVSSVNNVRSSLMDYIDWLSDRINSLRDNIIEDIIGLSNWIEWKLSLIPGLISDTLAGWANSINEFIIYLRDATITYVVQRADELFNWVNETFGWVVVLRDALIDLVNLVSYDNIGRMMEFINTWANIITLFFQNPLVFILDILQDVILSYLSYVLAWSMGTTIYDLPSTPPWRK